MHQRQRLVYWPDATFEPQLWWALTVPVSATASARPLPVTERVPGVPANNHLLNVARDDALNRGTWDLKVRSQFLVGTLLDLVLQSSCSAMISLMIPGLPLSFSRRCCSGLCQDSSSMQWHNEISSGPLVYWGGLKVGSSINYHNNSEYEVSGHSTLCKGSLTWQAAGCDGRCCARRICCIILPRSQYCKARCQ